MKTIKNYICDCDLIVSMKCDFCPICGTKNDNKLLPHSNIEKELRLKIKKQKQREYYLKNRDKFIKTALDYYYKKKLSTT